MTEQEAAQMSAYLLAVESLRNHLRPEKYSRDLARMGAMIDAGKYADARDLGDQMRREWGELSDGDLTGLIGLVAFMGEDE